MHAFSVGWILFSSRSSCCISYNTIHLYLHVNVNQQQAKGQRDPINLCTLAQLLQLTRATTKLLSVPEQQRSLNSSSLLYYEMPFWSL